MLPSNELYITGLKLRWGSISEDSYLRNIEAIREINEIRFHSPVTFFVGENGSGKSTLLEAIAIAYGFNPEGGTKNYSFSTYDSHSELCDALTLIRSFRKAKWGYFLRAESFYNVASAQKYREYRRSITKSHTARAFFPSCSRISAKTGCISSTSPKRPCPRKGSLHCCSKCQTA